MSAVDWRSEQDYANLEKAETADIAWEWLRRDREYQGDLKHLTADQSNGNASRIPAEMGVVFSRLIPNRRSTDNRFSGHLKPSRPSCRSVNSARPAMLGNMPLIGPGCRGEFRHGPDGWHGIVALAGAIHRLYLPAIPAKGAPLSIELPLDANSDIRLQAAHRFWCAIEGRVLVHLLLRSLASVAGASF